MKASIRKQFLTYLRFRGFVKGREWYTIEPEQMDVKT